MIEAIEVEGGAIRRVLRGYVDTIGVTLTLFVGRDGNSLPHAIGYGIHLSRDEWAMFCDAMLRAEHSLEPPPRSHPCPR